VGWQGYGRVLNSAHLELCRAPPLLLLAPQLLLLARHRLLVARLAAQPVRLRSVGWLVGWLVDSIDLRVIGRHHTTQIAAQHTQCKQPPHLYGTGIVSSRGSGRGGTAGMSSVAGSGRADSRPAAAAAAAARSCSRRAACAASWRAWRASVARAKGAGWVGSRGATKPTPLAGGQRVGDCDEMVASLIESYASL
jgi:hypothetical protein